MGTRVTVLLARSTFLRQRVAVEGDVVAVIGGSEGQHGVPVAIGGDGSLVGEGHTACATGVNQDDSAIHFRRKDHPVAVNQDTFAGAVVQASGLRVTAVADIQIASSTAVSRPSGCRCARFADRGFG